MKIAICIPVYGQTQAKFTQSVLSMLSYFYEMPLLDPAGNPVAKEVKTFIVSCSMLPESRHRLTAEAIAWGADYMLCLDADHVFPDDALNRLLVHNLPVVGCNYSRRITPTGPTAAKGGELLYTTQEKAEAGEVEEVDHLGLGFVLINCRVFDVLQAHAEANGDGNFLPLFKFEETADKVGLRGEDVFFFEKLRAAGIPAHCDHALSWELGHCHEIILTNAHAVAQKDRWQAYQQKRATKFSDAADALEKSAA